ncbi:MAG: cadherin-like domain-containing protein [Pseudomonadota bacterium]
MFVKQISAFAAAALISLSLQAADAVPPEIQQPGTQPNEVGNFESPDKCDNCHAGYNLEDPGAEPATGWRGGAMGNAGRDPVFWATLAVAEQDFDGVGDLCIRCHSAKGWYGGRSTPTDGSGLGASDDNGIDCDTCHAMTNPDNSGINPSTGDPLQGVMNSPFIANCDPDQIVPDKCSTTGSPGEGFYGSGMLSLFPNVNVKLGPFSDAEARHQWQQSQWHRHPDFCGSCHDVSNPAVGDLAPGNGTQHGAPFVVSSQGTDPNNLGLPNLGGPIEEKAAFNNPPYAYGIVERTFSEYKSSPLSSTLVSAFDSLPADLKFAGGSLDVTYQAAIQAGTGGNYADGTDRYFSCQSCHMRPVGLSPTTGEAYPGCNKNGAPLRADLPRHDHTGGNYWFASMSQYQDANGTLLVGGGLNSTQLLAMDLGQERATKHLSEAGSLEVIGNSVKVTNLTGHKLITGYPEGRRMWLRIEWRDSADTVIRVDGDYGNLTVDLDQDGQIDDTVETILDLDGANTRIYEAHYAMTKEWADVLLTVGYPDTLELAYDRVSGDVATTLGDLAGMPPGSYVDTFHFAINNHVSHDNRIPPYQMSYDEARKRNALPVPDSQYGNPGTGGSFDHWDTVALNPPAGADHAHIQLLYQGTSWEYMQFLQRANKEQNAFLGQEGNTMMDAWLNADVVSSQGAPITGVMQINGDYKMVPPVVMATAAWGNTGGVNTHPVAVDDAYSVEQDITLTVNAPGVLSNDSDADGDAITAVQVSAAGSGIATLAADGSFTYAPNPGFTGTDSFTYHAVDSNDAPSNTATVTITVNPPINCSDYLNGKSCRDAGCSWSGKNKICQ